MRLQEVFAHFCILLYTFCDNLQTFQGSRWLVGGILPSKTLRSVNIAKKNSKHSLEKYENLACIQKVCMYKLQLTIDGVEVPKFFLSALIKKLSNFYLHHQKTYRLSSRRNNNDINKWQIMYHLLNSNSFPK